MNLKLNERSCFTPEIEVLVCHPRLAIRNGASKIIPRFWFLPHSWILCPFIFRKQLPSLHHSGSRMRWFLMYAHSPQTVGIHFWPSMFGSFRRITHLLIHMTSSSHKLLLAIHVQEIHSSLYPVLLSFFSFRGVVGKLSRLLHAFHGTFTRFDEVLASRLQYTPKTKIKLQKDSKQTEDR